MHRDIRVVIQQFSIRNRLSAPYIVLISQFHTSLDLIKLFMIHPRSERIYGRIYSPNGDLRVVHGSCGIYNGISKRNHKTKIYKERFITKNSRHRVPQFLFIDRRHWHEMFQTLSAKVYLTKV